MSSVAHEVPVAVARAVRRLLRPLVRLLIRYSVSLPLFAQWLKEVYVLSAEQDFPAPGERVTDSRITMLTGVHRKDVRRIRAEEGQSNPAAKSVALGAQVAAHWLTSPSYCFDNGEPRPLYRLNTEGEPSFEALVEEVSRQDLRARSVLDEWLRLGVVAIDHEERVCLQTQAFVPEAGFDEKAFIFGMTAHDHLAAGVHNLLGEKPAFFDRCVYYNNLTPDAVEKLKAQINDEAMVLLKSINRKARELQKRDSGKADANERFSLGVYFYREKLDEQSEDRRGD